VPLIICCAHMTPLARACFLMLKSLLRNAGVHLVFASISRKVRKYRNAGDGTGKNCAHAYTCQASGEAST
jgi:hypothetical protein